MKKYLPYILLTLYFFTYTIPQTIPGIIHSYDKIALHVFFVSLLNISSFIYIYLEYGFKDILNKITVNYHILSYLFFILISILSLLAADNLVEGIISLAKYLIFFTSFIAILTLSISLKNNYFNFFIAVSLIGILIESIFVNLSIYDSVVINGNFLTRGNEYRGFGANTNIAAFSILIKLLIPFFIIFNFKNKTLNFISYTFIFSSILSILLLMSRGAVLATIVIFFLIAFYVFLSKKRVNYFKFIFVSLVVSLSFLSYSFFNEKNATDILIDRFSTVTNPQSDASVNERANFYETSIQSIKRNPVIGIGVGNWKIKSIDLSKDIIQNYRVPYFVHNDFLQVTAEIGIIGGLCFMFFIFYPLIISLKQFIKLIKFDKNFLIFLILTVYIIDSLINFPMDRVISFSYLLFTLTLFYHHNKILKINEE